MFNYKCEECGKGTVKKAVFHDYKTKIKGYPFVVPEAIIGVCDNCGAKHFEARETKRWEALYLKDLESKHISLSAGDIVEIRKSLGLSMEDFAYLSGCTRQSIYNWEKADRTAPQSRMADLMLKIIRQSCTNRNVDVISFLIEEASKIGIEIKLKNHCPSGGSLIQLESKKTSQRPSAASGRLQLAAITEEEIEKRLKTLLRDFLVSFSPEYRVQEEPRLIHLYHDIDELAFTNNYYLNIFDESVLNQLEFTATKMDPAQAFHAGRIADLSQWANFIRAANEFIFAVVDNETSVDDVGRNLATLAPFDNAASLRFKSSDYLQIVRSMTYPASQKVEALIEHLIKDVNIAFEDKESHLRQLILWLRKQEIYGKVNSLMVNTSNNNGILVPLSVVLQPGNGQVNNLVPGSDNFIAAINRARSAMVEARFLSADTDIAYSFDLTDANYSGDSIGLAAAAAIYSAAMKLPIDPYTSFTGNINLNGQYKITAVNGIRSKLRAAMLNGCKRVFVPNENQLEVESSYKEKIKIHFVSDLLEVFWALTTIQEPFPENSVQAKKINILRTLCFDKGWPISQPSQIQNGFQFEISPLDLPNLKINIYHSGTHVPKTSDIPGYREVFDELAKLDSSEIPIRNISKTFVIKDSELRELIKTALDKNIPAEKRQEQHCEYSYRFVDSEEKLVIKQFINGKLLIQGSAGNLYKDILNILIPLYNLKNPNAQQSVDAYITHEAGKMTSSKEIAPLQVEEVSYPHIGTDESGKGDYFGPIVIAGVLVDEATKSKLDDIGIRDSKLLSDKLCRELAAKIREICKGRYEEIEILPERYNELYAQFKKEGKNLNHLLAWGHARAIESLLNKYSCSHAVADQFGDEKYILSKLMEKGKGIRLVQTPKGERFTAVAAASILARDRFLSRMDKLSSDYEILLPKGASDLVIDAANTIVGKRGIDELNKLAKIHHKTTQKITKES
jgi:ribonuclease HIII